MLPRTRATLATELAATIVAGERAHRTMLAAAALAVFGGLAGVARIAQGVDDDAIAHVVVGTLAVLVVAGAALAVAYTARRRYQRAQRKAVVLTAALDGGVGAPVPPDPPPPDDPHAA